MPRTHALRAALCALLAAASVAACGSAVPPNEYVHNRGGGDPTAAGGGALVGVGGQTVGPLGAAQPGASVGASGQPLPAGSSAAARPGGTGATDGATGGGSSGVPQVAFSGRAGSCAGFKNTTGISDSAIKLANISDVSGPVPGLFTSAQQAAKAFAAYFNSTSSICGRKLSVVNYDSQTSSVGDQQAATQACSDTFAAVGSMGAFDSGGASTVARCGIPDLRAIITTPERVASPVTFAADSIDPPDVSTAQYRVLKQLTGNAYQHMAVLYLGAGAAVPNAIADKKTAEHVGFHVDYFQAIDVTTFNYSPFVSAMIQDHITFVQYVGAYQYAIKIKQAMDGQNFKPAFMMDSVAYDPAFVRSGGSAVNGTYAFVNTNLFEEASRSPELQTYLTWLQRVAPGAVPSFFGIYAWGAMRLFAQLALQLGGQLTRASMLDAIRATHIYDSNGLFTPGDPGGKNTPPCQAVIQLVNGAWVRKSPYPYSCYDVYATGG
jgi:ABC-type branched-subunit amino acid transport system substrate-binding protein